MATPTGTTQGPHQTGLGSSALSGNNVTTPHDNNDNIDKDNDSIDAPGIDDEFSVSMSLFLANNLADGSVESGPSIKANCYIGNDNVKVGEGTANNNNNVNDNPKGKPDNNSHQPAPAPTAAPRPHCSLGGLALSRPELCADLWLPASSTAVNVMVTATCHHSSKKALKQASAHKISKYICIYIVIYIFTMLGTLP
jgi:hypothetical protein